MDYSISPDDDGKTVLSYIKNRLGLSRRILIRLKQTGGGICVNGTQRTVRCILQAGDVLSLALDDTFELENEFLVPSDISLDIVYEDDDLLAVNKPYNMVTHTSNGHQDDSLANAVAYYFRGRPFVFRAVNRLDRDTSGIVLIAKNQLAAYKMSLSLQNGEVEKIYRTVLNGEIESPCGDIKTYIRRCEKSIIERISSNNGTDSEFAHTKYNCVYRGNNISVVDASPITGRTHQLRVHFSSVGYPIIGDDLYGTADCRIARQALHAYKLSFPHPSTRKSIILNVPIPDDILNLYKEFYFGQ